MMLFTSDEELVRRQQESKRFSKTTIQHISGEDYIRFAVEDARELREHQRWREFAWLLFVAPIWGALLIWLLRWVIGKIVNRGA